jgi:hypothetical protein
MGKKRLLIILPGIILISVAIVIVINVSPLQSNEPLKDEVISDCHTLAYLAQKYWEKPLEMGGGGNSFNFWAIPVSLNTTTYGTYSVLVAENGESVQITGIPHDSLGCDWVIVTNVTPDDVSSTIVSNP